MPTIFLTLWLRRLLRPSVDRFHAQRYDLRYPRIRRIGDVIGTIVAALFVVMLACVAVALVVGLVVWMVNH